MLLSEELVRRSHALGDFFHRNWEREVLLVELLVLILKERDVNGMLFVPSFGRGNA